MKYVLIVSDGLHGHWYHFDNKGDMFRMWQAGGMCTMWEIVGNQLVRLAA